MKRFKWKTSGDLIVVKEKEREYKNCDFLQL